MINHYTFGDRECGLWLAKVSVAKPHVFLHCSRAMCSFQATDMNSQAQKLPCGETEGHAQTPIWPCDCCSSLRVQESVTNPGVEMFLFWDPRGRLSEGALFLFRCRVAPRVETRLCVALRTAGKLAARLRRRHADLPGRRPRWRSRQAPPAAFKGGKALPPPSETPP